jgi:hypothetical protein
LTWRPAAAGGEAAADHGSTAVSRPDDQDWDVACS